MLRVQRLVVIAALLAILLPLTAPAKAAALPRYAVAFPYQNGTRIAVLDVSGKWHVDDLPQAFSGTVDVNGIGGLITATWAPNQPTAYVISAPPGDAQYRAIYAYDLLTKQQTPVVTLDKGGTDVDYAQFEVSPDGRYLWAWYVGGVWNIGDNQLIDTQAPANKRILTKVENCHGWPIDWRSAKLLITCEIPDETSDSDVRSTVKLFDLKTGDRLASYQVTDINITLLGEVIPLPADPSVDLIYSYPGGLSLAKVSLETAKVEKWSDATIEALAVSQDQKSAAFVSNGRLYALNLQTLATTDLGDIGHIREWFTTRDSVSFWTGDKSAQRVTVQGTHRVDVMVCKSCDAVMFAPGGQGFMSAVNENSQIGYELYTAQGKRTWRSQDESPEVAEQLHFFPALSGPPQFVWTDDGWLMGQIGDPKNADNYASYGRGFAVNVATGKTRLAPEQAPLWVSASPDGVWWLYAWRDSATDSPKDKLFAYNVESHEMVPLAEGVTLPLRGDPPDRPFDYFTWSPIYSAQAGAK